MKEVVTDPCESLKVLGGKGGRTKNIATHIVKSKKGGGCRTKKCLLQIAYQHGKMSNGTTRREKILYSGLGESERKKKGGEVHEQVLFVFRGETK